MKGAVVLVHGSQHGSWCWERVLRGLAEKGISAVAVDLPGRGDNVNRPVTMAENVAVIEEAIEALGGPVLLCGHSAAGLPISIVAASNPQVRQLVYIAAILPPGDEVMHGVIEELMERARQHLRMENGTVASGSFEETWALNYHDCSEEEARWAFSKLVPEPAASLDQLSPDALSVKPWEKVPTTYAMTLEDRGIPIHLQRRLATRAHDAVEWPASHSPFLSRPDLVVDLLAGKIADMEA